MAAERDRDGYEAALEAKVAAWKAALDAYRAAKAIDGPVGEVGARAASQTAAKGAGAGFELPVAAGLPHPGSE